MTTVASDGADLLSTPVELGPNAWHEPRASARRRPALVRLSTDNTSGLRYLRHASWGAAHDLAVFCDLLCLEKLPQLLHVILEFGGKRLADFVDFFDNG